MIIEENSDNNCELELPVPPAEAHYTVYKLTDPEGKIYIGCTGKTVEERWNRGQGYQKGTPYRADLGRAFYQQFSEAEAEDPDGIPEEGTVTITEGEFRLYSRAWLVVTALRDLLQIMNDFQ